MLSAKYHRCKTLPKTNDRTTLAARAWGTRGLVSGHAPRDVVRMMDVRSGETLATGCDTVLTPDTHGTLCR